MVFFVLFLVWEGEVWVSKYSDDIFKDRIVVVFFLSGVFMLICLFMYLFCYNVLVKVFKKYGVDEIVCVLVNDMFVMNVWGVD